MGHILAYSISRPAHAPNFAKCNALDISANWHNAAKSAHTKSGWLLLEDFVRGLMS